MKDKVYSLFLAHYWLSALQQMDKSNPVLCTRLQRHHPGGSLSCQRQLSTSETPHLQFHLSNLFFPEGLENDDATPWKSIIWCTATKRDWRLNWKVTKEKPKQVCKEVKRILDIHIYVMVQKGQEHITGLFLATGSWTPWAFNACRYCGCRTVKRKDQLHVGCTSHVCQD